MLKVFSFMYLHELILWCFLVCFLYALACEYWFIYNLQSMALLSYDSRWSQINSGKVYLDQLLRCFWMFKNVTIFHDFLLKQNGVKYFVPLIRVLNCKANVGGPFKLVFQVSFRWSDILKYFTIFCKTKMVPDKFCPTNSCLNFKTDLGETIKPIFETFLEWSTILKYFMIFLKIKIVADFLLSLKFVLNGI